MSSPTGIHPRSRPITALRKPSGATLVIAALVSAALLIFSGVAVWRHMGGSSGDPVDERGAVITRVGGAVDAASTHAATCSAGLTSLASAAIDQSTDTNMAEFESCGKTARALAEMGLYRARWWHGPIRFTATRGLSGRCRVTAERL